MRAFISFAVVVTLGMSGVTAAAAGPAPPQADRRDTPGCVSKKEFKRTPKGTRIRVVHRRYDTHGWTIDRGPGGIVRGYKFCKRARHQADTRKFTVVYRSGAKRARVFIKYCGPSYQKRWRCFR